jgi:hypothetical protein
MEIVTFSQDGTEGDHRAETRRTATFAEMASAMRRL